MELRFPLQPGEGHGEVTVLQPMEAEIHLEPIEDPHQSRGILKEAGTLWEDHSATGSWQESMDRGTHAGAGLLTGLVTL